MTWGFLLAYLTLQLLLGAFLSRRIQSEGDYFVGGRRLGTGVVALSLFATWFGAETCLRSSGAIYERGLSGARADPLGYSLCLLLMGPVLAVPLHRGGYMTLGDFYKRRFGVQIEKLAVLVLVPSSLIWAAAQVRAFGQVVAATMDVNVTLAVYLASAFVVAYTFLGGLLGDVATDVLQGAILTAGLSSSCPLD
jgi:solute:Na+ symporter, SSS family